MPDTTREFVHGLTEEAETAARQNLKRLYDITHALSGKNLNSNNPVKDKNGRTITSDAEQRARWVEHFEEILNRPPPPVTPDIPAAEEPLRVNISPPTKADITKAKRILEAMEQAAKEGKGAVSLDGRLIDYASIRQAEVLVEKAAQIAAG